MAKFQYATKKGTLGTLEAADQGSALSMLRTLADADPSSGVMPVQAPQAAAPAAVPEENANRNYNYGPDAPAVSPLQSPTPPPNNIQSPQLPSPTAPAVHQSYVTSATEQATQARTALDAAYKRQLDTVTQQKQQAETRIKDLESKQQGVIDNDIQPLLKPFREALENSERERLYINKNFEENQTLIDELDSLLTEGNAIIEEKKAFGGVSFIRDARVNKTIEDVSARAGVIQAVITARSGQIAEAQRLIDRSVTAINADREDRLAYFKTVFDFYENQKDEEGNKLIDLTKEEKTYIAAQIGLLEGDMKRANDTADAIKAAMLDPDLAQVYGQAGVTLNDTLEQIQTKLATYAKQKEIRDLSNAMAADGFVYLAPGQKAPANAQVVTTTDSSGNERKYYKMPTSAAAASAIAGITPRTGAPSESASGVDGQAMVTAARGLRYSSVAEANRIIGDVTAFVNAGDLKGAEDVLRQFGYQKLPVSTQQDYDLYENARSAFEAVVAQLDKASLEAGPYKALSEAAKPWLLIGRDEEYTNLRAIIEQGQAQLRKGYYGTAVTGTEAGNAKNFLVTDNDDISTIKWKAEQGAAFLQFVNDAQIARAVGLPKPDLASYLSQADTTVEDDDAAVFEEVVGADKPGTYLGRLWSALWDK